MKLNIRPTHTIETIEGVRCRLWTGTDAQGVEVHVWVQSLSPQTHDEADLAAFDDALERLPPTGPPKAIDYRYFVD